MKWHVFSLNRVMRVRATQESVARQGLRTAVTHVAYAEQDYDSANRRYQANLATQASLRGSGMNLLALRDLNAMRARAIIEADHRRGESHAALDEAQERWAQAKQKLAALERLDDREREAHRRRALAMQDAEADDVVSSRRRVTSDQAATTSGDGDPR